MQACENLTHYTPDSGQYEKFDKINNLPEEVWERRCCLTNDCSICDMAIHQFLLSTTKHICVYGMTRKDFENRMDNADVDF